MVSGRHSIRVSHCGERGVRGRPGASTQGHAQPTTAPLHWQGHPASCASTANVRGLPDSNQGTEWRTGSLPKMEQTQAMADRFSTGPRGPQRPCPNPRPTWPPRPQPQVHPRGSADSSLSYVVNLPWPHLLTLIQCTAGQELQGAAGGSLPALGTSAAAGGGSWAPPSRGTQAAAERPAEGTWLCCRAGAPQLASRPHLERPQDPGTRLSEPQRLCGKGAQWHGGAPLQLQLHPNTNAHRGAIALPGFLCH